MNTADEFETRSSLKDAKKNRQHLMFWNVVIAVALCLIVGAAFFVIKSVVSENTDNKTFSGSRDLMDTSQIEEIDGYHTDKLKSLGVNVDSIDFNSEKNVDEVLKKIDKSNLELSEKSNVVSGFAGLANDYFVEDNQSKIEEYIEKLKNIVDEKELQENHEAHFYLLNIVFQSSVVDYAISPHEKDENLKNIDEFVFDLRRIANDLYIENERWDSDKTQERLRNIAESATVIKVSQV